jgi:TusA-related sulfurtransferase
VEPYCETYMDLTHDLLWEQASHGVKAIPMGYSAPVIYNAMERQGAACAKPNTAVLDSAFEVGSFHCACVLQADVADGLKVRSAARVAAMQAGDLSLIPAPTSTASQRGSPQSMDLLSASVIRSTGGRARSRNVSSALAHAGTLPPLATGRIPPGEDLRPDANPPAQGQQAAVGPVDGTGFREKAVLDGMGLATTELLLVAAQQMRALRPGETLKVVSDDFAVGEDLGAWCRMTGNELAGIIRGRGYVSCYVRRIT